MSKISGTVKWFSNKKGFGFISPTSDNSPTKEEIFVHQTNIVSGGAYRTLIEGAEVEFDVETEDGSGKLKAVNVTAPGGAALTPPPREKRQRRPPRAKEGGAGEAEAPAEDENRDNAEKTEKKGGRRTAPPKKDDNDSRPKREAPFHAVIVGSVKEKITASGLVLGQRTTIDVSFGEARVKLGQGGYAGLAHASGMIGEGTYTCDENGVVTFTWEHCLSYVDGAWKAEETSKLMPTLSLSADGIGPVKSEETPVTLWGEGKADPREAFEANGFKMKKVMLSKPAGTGGNRGRRGGGRR